VVRTKKIIFEYHQKGIDMNNLIGKVLVCENGSGIPNNYRNVCCPLSYDEKTELFRCVSWTKPLSYKQGKPVEFTNAFIQYKAKEALEMFYIEHSDQRKEYLNDPQLTKEEKENFK
jgi:hypothetical protein